MTNINCIGKNAANCVEHLFVIGLFRGLSVNFLFHSPTLSISQHALAACINLGNVMT